jgi:hypothetical protein
MLMKDVIKWFLFAVVLFVAMNVSFYTTHGLMGTLARGQSQPPLQVAPQTIHTLTPGQQIQLNNGQTYTIKNGYTVDAPAGYTLCASAPGLNDWYDNCADGSITMHWCNPTTRQHLDINHVSGEPTSYQVVPLGGCPQNVPQNSGPQSWLGIEWTASAEAAGTSVKTGTGTYYILKATPLLNTDGSPSGDVQIDAVQTSGGSGYLTEVVVVVTLT